MKKILVLMLCAASLTATACSSLPAMPSIPFLEAEAPAEATVVPPAPATVRERVSRAIDLLGQGDPVGARSELKLALDASPKDATAQSLMKQIETDPVVLLGEASRNHVAAPGDTLSVLAGRYLGDPLLFYALSRYNGLDAPNALAVGRTLKIPLREGETNVLEAGGASTKGKTVPAAASPVAADAEKANAIRLRGLESLNKGDVAQAVALLKQAEALNSIDPAIQRDLQRALRIQSALADG